METSAHSLLASWESFYVIVGSSAAALTGLQFVVIALVADTPGFGTEDSVAAFGTPSVVHFCLCLFLSAFLSAPWPSLTPVMWLLLGVAIAGVLYTLIVLRRPRRRTGNQAVVEDWLSQSFRPPGRY